MHLILAKDMDVSLRWHDGYGKAVGRGWQAHPPRSRIPAFAGMTVRDAGRAPRINSALAEVEGRCAGCLNFARHERGWAVANLQRRPAADAVVRLWRALALGAAGEVVLPAAVAAIILVALKDRQAPTAVVREVSWSVIPLVAGLFIIVEALKDAGTLRIAQDTLQIVSAWPVFRGDLAGAFGVALISNLMNNLPVGLIGANALEHAHIPASMKNAFLIGVDLGPNLSVTGSLATILWLITLRKEGFQVTAWTFLKFGVLVMPLALIAAVVALVFCS